MVESVTFKKKKAPCWLLSTDILPTSWWLLVCNFMGFQRIKRCIIMFGYSLGSAVQKQKEGVERVGGEGGNVRKLVCLRQFNLPSVKQS